MAASCSSRTRTSISEPVRARRSSARASSRSSPRTAAEALELAGRVEPDLVLLDLNLPDGDGRDVCRALRRDSDVPIVMLTARGTEIDRIVGLELGADDYVVKPFSGAEVISRIRAVLRAQPAARAGRSSRAFSVGGLELDVAARTRSPRRRRARPLPQGVRPAGASSARRRARRHARGPDVRVWDANWFGSTKTLDVHIGWLRRKLGDDPADPRYIETVRGVGFRFAAPEDGEP